MLELESSIAACLPSGWEEGEDSLGLSSSSELHLTFHGATPCAPSSSPGVHCAPRSRYRLDAQAAPICGTLTSRSTSVNLSFSIFKIKKIRASVQGLLCTSSRHAQKKGNTARSPRGDSTWWLPVTFKSVTTLSDGIIHLDSSLPER